jgi:hypothetical protein
MTSVNSPSIADRYPPRTLERAERAVRCSPFRMSLFVAMGQTGIPLGTIAGTAGVRHGYTRRAVPELVAESELLWLIQVGMLRREVDGQGLTDSFRLTPLGRILLEQWQPADAPLSSPSWRDRLLNRLSRWRQWLGWL